MQGPAPSSNWPILHISSHPLASFGAALGGQPVLLAAFCHCIQTVPWTCSPRQTLVLGMCFVLSVLRPYLGKSTSSPLLKGSPTRFLTPAPFYLLGDRLLGDPEVTQARHPDPPRSPGRLHIHPHTLCGGPHRTSVQHPSHTGTVSPLSTAAALTTPLQLAWNPSTPPTALQRSRQAWPWGPSCCQQVLQWKRRPRPTALPN